MPAALQPMQPFFPVFHVINSFRFFGHEKTALITQGGFRHHVYGA